MTYPLQNAKREIIENLASALQELKLEVDIKLEKPPSELGDFAFPCFQIAKIAKKSPNAVAEEIKGKLKRSDWVEKIEVKNGYVNFFINKERISSLTLDYILKKREKYGDLNKKNKKVIIEHTSANPNGPLHVGRARNPIIGDTLVRIFKSAGYKVESQFYLDDMGKQVAILAWGVNNLKIDEVPKASRDKPDHKYVGFYQVANKKMEENQKVAEEIEEIIRRSESGDQKTLEMIKRAYYPVLEGMKESLARINVFIDRYVPESRFVKDKSVNYVVEELKKSKLCNEEEGAFYLDMESFGIKGRDTKFFFLRKDGTTLYATRDIAYHLWKAEQADILINVLGEDHKLESKQVEICLNLLKAKIVPKVVFYSFVSLPEGKMSTRKGRVVYLDDLIDECINRAYEEVKKRRGRELPEKKMKKIAEMVGIGALRYNVIKVQPEKDMVFRWEDALNFEGDSAPFIQYAHARACSILSKNKESIDKVDARFLMHKSEIDLIKKLAELPIVIEECCNELKPHMLANYLFEVASLFNQFYRDCPVLHEENKDKRIARICLVEACRIVLKKGLNLLGIEAPEEM